MPPIKEMVYFLFYSINQSKSKLLVFYFSFRWSGPLSLKGRSNALGKFFYLRLQIRDLLNDRKKTVSPLSLSYHPFQLALTRILSIQTASNLLYLPSKAHMHCELVRDFRIGKRLHLTMGFAYYCLCGGGQPVTYTYVS